MGKCVFLAAFLAALVAVSVAQGVSEQSYRDIQCRREVQENPLYACRQVVDRQLTGRAPGLGGRLLPPLQSGSRARCCEQLQGVNRECRCAAIRRMVRDYEQTMAPPLEAGWSTEQQAEQGYYGEPTAEQQQQPVEGYYGGETPRRQQGQEYYGERPHQRQQGEEGYYGGETARRQQGQEHYGQQQQAGEGYYGGETATERQQWQDPYYGQGAGSQEQQGSTRVRLMRVRQYVARLPTMCQMEPLECSVFSYGQY